MGQKTEKLFERAKNNLKENDHENALRLFNEVLNREPGHAQALRNKGLIKILNDSPKEAEEFLLFAIEQQPSDHQLHQMLGTFYYNNNNPQKARSYLKRATELEDTNYLAHRGLGMLYAHYFGDHDKAVSHFTKVLENDRPSGEIFFNRGCSRMILNQMEQAKQDLKEAAGLNHKEAQAMLEKYFS